MGELWEQFREGNMEWDLGRVLEKRIGQRRRGFRSQVMLDESGRCWVRFSGGHMNLFLM